MEPPQLPSSAAAGLKVLQKAILFHFLRFRFLGQNGRFGTWARHFHLQYLTARIICEGSLGGKSWLDNILGRLRLGAGGACPNLA